MGRKNRAFDYAKYKTWINPEEVKPYENNVKLHPPEQVTRIANSIKRFGWQQDTVLTADNVVVVGHGRWLAAKQLGCKMPYHRVGKNADELTDDEVKALRLADNKTAESGWDFGRLEEELTELKGFGMSDFGFASMDSGFQNPLPETETHVAYDDGPEEPDVSDYVEEEEEEPDDSVDAIWSMRRVIITYDPDREPDVKRLLGITDERVAVVYSIDTLMGVQ